MKNISSIRSTWLVTLAMLLFAVLPVAAQNIAVSGNISDENGEPIIGANVTVVNNKGVGAISDLDGNFKLTVPTNSTLEVSFIGYVTQKVKVNGKSLKIVMKEDAAKLDEVIVVGYGNQKRANLSGSVASITSEKLTTTKNGNIQNMVTGKLAGVRSIQKTSEPGNFNNQFDIRGFGSPTIVIDGIPRGNMESIDPNDIESISVLKDASASIYGVASANGVVLITTKQGSKGKAEIEYSTYYTLQTPAEVLRPVGTYDRMTLLNEKYKRDKPHDALMYSAEDFERLATGETGSYDWYDATIRGTAPEMQHNLSIKGGTDAVNYYVNMGYYMQESFFRQNDVKYERYNLRANLNAQITKRLKASLRLAGTLNNRNRPYLDSWEVFKMLWRTDPSTPVYANNNPLYYSYPAVQNNAVAVTDSETIGYKQNRNKLFNSSFDLTYDIPGVKGLSVKGMFSWDTRITDNSNFQRIYTLYNYDKASDTYPIGAEMNSPNRITRQYSNSESRLWNVSINYKNTIAEHYDIDAMLLYEDGYNYGDGFNAQRDVLLPLPYLSVGTAENQQATGSAPSEYAKKSLVGRLNFQYRNRYIMEAAFRYDGSSRYLPSNQWNIFPSVSLAWRASEEAFVKKALPFVSNLKLRGSWGKLGTDSDNLYTFLDGYDYPAGGNKQNGYPKSYYFGNSLVPATSVRATANPNISWITINIANIGLDVDLWDGLFGASLDIFQRDRNGLYAKRNGSLPAIFGSDMPQENLNSDRTKGFELELRHHHRVGDLRYSLSGNLSLTRTMNRYVERGASGNSYENWTGNSQYRYNDIWWGYGSVGRFTSYTQIQEYPIGGMNGNMVGDYIYEDWNGDGVVDGNDKHPIATTVNPGSDWQNKKNYPLMTFGFSGNFQYKGFDLDFLLQGAAMSYVSYGEQLGSSLAWDGNALEQFLDRWHPVDPEADPNDPNTKWVSGYYPYGSRVADINSRFMIQNGAYLRLKSLTLGYTLPKQWLAPLGVNNLRVYVSGYNLLTFTGVKGLDPEKPTELNGYMYPLNRTYTFGASIRF